MFCRPLSNYPPSHCHSETEIFLLSLNLNTQPHKRTSIQADIRWWQCAMIGLILASIWLLFMKISPGLCFSFQALTRQKRPGLLSNLLWPLLVTATYELMSVGGNTEINTENMSRSIKIFRGKVILLVTRARSPWPHANSLSPLTTVYSLDSDHAIIVMWEFGHFWHCLKLDISAKSSE